MNGDSHLTVFRGRIIVTYDSPGVIRWEYPCNVSFKQIFDLPLTYHIFSFVVKEILIDDTICGCVSKSVAFLLLQNYNHPLTVTGWRLLLQRLQGTQSSGNHISYYQQCADTIVFRQTDTQIDVDVFLRNFLHWMNH